MITGGSLQRLGLLSSRPVQEGASRSTSLAEAGKQKPRPDMADCRGPVLSRTLHLPPACLS
jgi:hypothetical protein